MEFGRKWLAVGALAAAVTVGAVGVASADDPDERRESNAPAPISVQRAPSPVSQPGGEFPVIDVSTCDGWYDDWDDRYPDHVEEFYDDWDDRCDDLHDDDDDDRDDDFWDDDFWDD